MRLKERLWQNRRDFEAIYICESCKHNQLVAGYDDRNFHDNVAPTIKCKKCGKSRIDLKIEGEYIETRYPEGMQI